MKFYLCEKHLKLDRSKGTEKFMDANMHEFGKRSFQIELKIEKMIFVIAHKTPRSHLEALTAKKIWSILH